MSRICVKNLPRYMAEDRLREVFSQKGEITDAKIMRTKDGKSRQFAFIGFRNEEEAKEAILFFHNSYLDTYRITCEVAHKVGDPNIPRPWSHHSAMKQDENQESNNSNLTNSKNSKETNGFSQIAKNPKQNNKKNDLELEEFLQVMQPRSKSKLWGNDTSLCELTKKDEMSIDNIQSLKHRRKVKLSQEGKEDGEDDNKENDKAHDVTPSEGISDMDYFKSKVKKNWSDSDSDSSDDDESNILHEENVDGQQVDVSQREGSSGCNMIETEGQLSPSREEKDEAFENGRLFIRNLPYTTNEDDLKDLCSQYGDVSQVHLVVDKDTKHSKGIAYVLYTVPESAIRAMKELDNSIFQGRLLHIMPAKKQPCTEKLIPNSVADQGIKSFKQKRQEEKKASEASGNTKAWNSLFMRPDTVVENIARKYGVSKSDFLDREADDLAVRIALGETHVIAETKKSLVNAGVNISVLEDFASGKCDHAKRSGYVILVKNLPYGSSEEDLCKMFGKFGSLDKIILPPTKALALVIFLEATEARAAFRGMAYKRYKDGPLYLEWAPEDILQSKSSLVSSEVQDSVVGGKDVKRVLIEQQIEAISEVEIDPDRAESRTLFVKNLNFKTSEEVLREFFIESIKQGKIHSVKIKKHLKNGKHVSMGFGFIEFDSTETAENVCRDLQGRVLDGHALVLQRCHTKDKQTLIKVEKEKSSTKLIVRNVAFEATVKDLRQLFSPFGQIKSLRLPTKLGGHRGFAFVEYVTKQEAQNALEALSSTHLYGRHLVLERAKEGETLEELRARTAAQFVNEQNGFETAPKLSKKRKHLSVLDEGHVKFERITD